MVDDMISSTNISSSLPTISSDGEIDLNNLLDWMKSQGELRKKRW